MARILGFEITRQKDEEHKSFVLPAEDEQDGSVHIDGGFGAVGWYLDQAGTIKSDNELINKYREIAVTFEVDNAINDIINESIVTDENKQPVSVNLDDLNVSDDIKKKIGEEFREVLRLLGFNSRAHDIFRKWYIDGRLYYHKVIDETKPKAGLQEVRPIDPRSIKKMKKVDREVDPKTSAVIIKKIEEFYLFSSSRSLLSADSQSPDMVGTSSTYDSVPIAKDSIAYVHSGLSDERGRIVGHLQKALKPMNQLRMVEDAIVIYRISRAPERRIFYVDVGNLPKIKAEQYLKGVMTRFRNKFVYDTTTGAIRDDRRWQAMLEDYWLPRREGGRGTEVSTLPAGQNLGELEDVKYFQRKLYKSLHVPQSRLDEDSGGFQLGRAAEINRDELKFTKFVNRLRNRFNHLFLDLLRTQLILKSIITAQDWELFKDHINFDYIRDAHFAELKRSELMRDRLETLSQAEQWLGKFYSEEWVRRNILQQTTEEIELNNDQINSEKDQGAARAPEPYV